jgi:hypothetical protein
MGFFSNLFPHKGADYPALDTTSRAGRKVAEVRPELRELLHKVKQPLEVVPSEHAAYVFIGKPPNKFGLAWIHEGTVSGLNTLIQEHGVQPAEIDRTMEALREAYTRHGDAPHYTTTIDDKRVVVTASEQLEHEVHDIIDRILH